MRAGARVKHFSFFPHKIFKINTNLLKTLLYFFLKKCAGACDTHYQNLCDVHAVAAENPRILKVWSSESYLY